MVLAPVTRQVELNHAATIKLLAAEYSHIALPVMQLLTCNSLAYIHLRNCSLHLHNCSEALQSVLRLGS